jgi:hypothetical protein
MKTARKGFRPTGWTLDLFFGREIEQLITLRDVEMLSDRLARKAVPARSRAPAHKMPGTETRAESLRRGTASG